eukprot:1109967-Pyramimonas_sp.AAC.1
MTGAGGLPAEGRQALVGVFNSCKAQPGWPWQGVLALVMPLQPARKRRSSIGARSIVLQMLRAGGRF